MPKALDLTGQKFGRLTALRKANSRSGKTYWLCECECGNQKEVQTCHLTGGKIQSCGCLQPRVEKEENCLFCGKQLINSQKKYCSQVCQRAYEKEQYIKKWKAGEVSGTKGSNYQLSDMVREYIWNKYSGKCSKCGWHEPNPQTKTSPLEINHIDGDASNCSEENLELLCPNCHSLTPNWKNCDKHKSARR